MAKQKQTKKKRRFEHFDPEEHKIESKIASVKSGRHCKFNINYHIIWIPKYRKPVLFGRVAEVLKTIIEGVCLDNGCENLALEIMPDHLHLFIGTRPNINLANLIKLIKGNTSKQLRQAFPDLKYLGYAKHYKKFDNLWARGYYCGTAGHVSQEQVRRYILEQEGKSVFEYDIYGVPEELKGQLKIGDFTNG
jgi:putative transposase